MTTFLLSAGDASGELHAAALVTALRTLHPEARFLGLGGAEMEKAGVELVVHQREIAIGGLVEVLRDLRQITSAWGRLNRALRETRPDVVILVDAPDFNIPFARRAKRAGSPVLYYVSPQVWAWRRGRIGRIARRVDRLAVIFPFEVEVYRETSLRVDFVGHPLVDRLSHLADQRDTGAAREALGLDPQRPLVALLPGSRRNEVRGTLPLQLRAAAALHARQPTAGFAVGVAASIPREVVDAALAAARLPAGMALQVFEARTYEVLLASDVALAKPGTVTVESAMLGTPLVVAARANSLTAFIMRRVVKLPSITMPNLIAEERVVPEFLQQDAEPERIAAALQSLLSGPARARQLAALGRVREQLGAGGAAQRVAAIAAGMVGGSRAS